MSTDRTKFLSSAYARATALLRKNHSEEFHEILAGIYEQEGVDVKKRLTGIRKKKAQLAKLQEELATSNPPV